MYKRNIFLVVQFLILSFLLIHVRLTFCEALPISQGHEWVAKIQMAGLTDQEKAWLRANPVIELVTSSKSAPYQYLGKDGKAAGLIVDYAKALEKRMGVRLEVVPLDWKVTAARMKQGSPILYGTTIESLHKVLNPSYLPTNKVTRGYVSLFRKKIGAGPVNVHELEGATIALFGVSQVIPHPFLDELKKRNRVVVFDSNSETIGALLTGEIDYFIALREIALFQLRAAQVSGVEEAYVLPEAEEGFFLVRPDSPLLLSIMNKAIADIERNELQGMLKKWQMDWLSDQAVQLSEEEKTWIAGHPVIHIGVDPNYPPIEFVDDEGGYKGIAADSLKLVAERLGLRFEVVPGLTWPEVVEGAKRGVVDVVPVMTPTRERREFLNFTSGYIPNSQVIIVRKDHPAVSGFAALADETVAVTKGYSEVAEIRERFPAVRMYEVDNPLEELRAVATGMADACQGGLTVTGYLVQENNLLNLKIGGPSDVGGEGTMSMGVRKDWPILRNLLQKALDSITETEHRAISQKWVPGLSGEFTNVAATPGIELTAEEKDWLSEHPVIRVGADPGWAPVESVGRDGKFSGISVDFLDLLAKKLKVRFDFVGKTTWAETVEGVKKREIDILSAAGQTASREKYVNFTKPFLTLPNAFFTRGDHAYIRNPEELHGERVAVVKGHSIAEYLRQNYPGMDLVEVSDVKNALERILSGDVDVYVDSLLTTTHAIQKYGYSGVKVAGQAPYDIALSMAARNDWPLLIRILDKAIAAIPLEQRNAIFRKWQSFRIEQAFDSSLLWKTLIPAVLVLLAILYWNRRLASEVALRVEDIRKSEQRYRLLAENVSDVIWTMDRDMKLTYVSPSSYNFRGYNPEEVLSQDLENMLTSDSFERVRSVFVQEMALEKEPGSYPGKNIVMDLEFIHKDGRTVWGEVSVGFVGGGDGQISMVLGATRDITARKKAEKALRATQYSIDTSEIAVFWVRPDSSFAYVNDAACRSLGYTRKELLTMSVPDIDPDWTADYWAREGWQKIKRVGRLVFEARHRHKDGTIKPEEISTSYFVFEDEEYVFVFSQDITDRKNAEDELLKSRQTLQNLTAYLQMVREEERSYVAREIHDEMGQSLTTLKIDASSLKGWVKGKDQQKILDTMLKAIDDTMRVARRLSTEMRPSILDDFGLSESVIWLGTDFEERSRIKCDVTVDPDLSPIDAERSTTIFRIIQEALTNAYRHSGAKRVVVGLSESEGSIHLEVMDDGKGITPEEMSGPKSFGIIGMRERVRSLGGEFEVVGSPGKGTAVRVSIPVKVE